MTDTDPGPPGREMAGAILAGGRSRRLGRDKRLLSLGGERVIGRILRALQPVCAQRMIIAGDPAAFAAFGVEVHPDRVPDQGALGGILTALTHSRHPHTFCIACDMPFPVSALIGLLGERAAGVDLVVPRTARGVEPLCAVYARNCLGPIQALLAAGERRVDRLVAAVRVRFVEEAELRRLDPDLRSLVNVNTAEDLAAAERMAAEGGAAGPEA